MSVAVKDRKINKVGFIRKYKNIVFNMNALLKELPKKYKYNYEDVIIDELLKVQKWIVYGNEINISYKNFPNLFKRDFKERQRNFRKAISGIDNVSLIFTELLDSLYKTNEIGRERYESLSESISVEMGEVIDMINSLTNYDKKMYKEFKKYRQDIKDLKNSGHEDPENEAIKMVHARMKN